MDLGELSLRPNRALASETFVYVETSLANVISLKYKKFWKAAHLVITVEVGMNIKKKN